MLTQCCILCPSFIKWPAVLSFAYMRICVCLCECVCACALYIFFLFQKLVNIQWLVCNFMKCHTGCCYMLPYMSMQYITVFCITNRFSANRWMQHLPEYVMCWVNDTSHMSLKCQSSDKSIFIMYTSVHVLLLVLMNCWLTVM